MNHILKNNPIWLSLLIHLLSLSAATVVWVGAPTWEPKPSMYVPAYIATPPTSTTQPQQALHKEQQKVETATSGLLTPAKQQLSSPQVAAEPDQQRKPGTVTKKTEPIHLVGDSKVVKPLIKLLGKAITAHLIYPKIAEDFSLHGVAVIGFTLHPDGHITDAQVVRSSKADVLDQAALDAINHSSPLNGVSEFVDQPKFLTVGIIFG